MEDKQKVYIKGSEERGNEVIKFLEDLGGRNSHSMDGKNVNAYYFINPNGIIVNTYSSGSEIFSYVKEFYKEMDLPKWKPQCGEQYFFISKIGKVMEDTWRDLISDNFCYEFGNCFRTYEEAEAARDKIKEILK